MTALDRALLVIKEHEGGEVTDEAADPGGVTKFGVSLRFLRSIWDDFADVDGDGDVDEDDIRGMTWPMAARIFTIEFWDRYGYETLPEDVAIKLFDLAVNCGPRQAHLILQRACRAGSDRVTEDGLLGPRTRASVAAALPHVLVACLRCEAASFYRQLVAKRPELGSFLNGWLTRAYD
jgi:lysozyme family protein